MGDFLLLCKLESTPSRDFPLATCFSLLDIEHSFDHSKVRQLRDPLVIKIASENQKSLQ